MDCGQIQIWAYKQWTQRERDDKRQGIEEAGKGVIKAMERGCKGKKDSQEEPHGL